MKITGQVFGRDEEVLIDGNIFERCEFDGSRMIFAARPAGAMGFLECTFTNVQWTFVEAAQATIHFLHAISSQNEEYGRAMLVNTFPVLREWLKDEVLSKLPAEKGHNG
jgi:hypothetical protein